MVRNTTDTSYVGIENHFYQRGGGVKNTDNGLSRRIFSFSYTVSLVFLPIFFFYFGPRSYVGQLRVITN